MRSIFIFAFIVVFWKSANATVIVEDVVKNNPLKSQTILGNAKDKPHNGRSLIAVNEQAQERSSSRFFGPPGYGAYPGIGGPAQFPGAFGGYPGGYGGGYGGYPGYLGGYPGGFGGGYPGGIGGGYPGGYGNPQAGAFSGQAGFGYGLQQQQQLQGGGFASGAFAG